MNEKYYKILGLDENATDEEIKKAYITLKRKYDPNNYEKEDLKEHAKEKTKEIIEAFDAIMNERRAKNIENEKENKETTSKGEENFKAIEKLIESNLLQRAEQELMNIPQEKRTARWYYLKGVILYKKGWLLEASNFFATASNLEPSNEEYKEALEKANWQRRGGFNEPQSGPYGPYSPTGPMGCSFCDVCGTIMCMDMCCDCIVPRNPYRCF